MKVAYAMVELSRWSVTKPDLAVLVQTVITVVATAKKPPARTFTTSLSAITNVTYGLGRQVTLATSGLRHCNVANRYHTGWTGNFFIIDVLTTTPAWCRLPITRTPGLCHRHRPQRLCRQETTFLTGGYGVVSTDDTSTRNAEGNNAASWTWLLSTSSFRPRQIIRLTPASLEVYLRS